MIKSEIIEELANQEVIASHLNCYPLDNKVTATFREWIYQCKRQSLHPWPSEMLWMSAFFGKDEKRLFLSISVGSVPVKTKQVVAAPPGKFCPLIVRETIWSRTSNASGNKFEVEICILKVKEGNRLRRH